MTNQNTDHTDAQTTVSDRVHTVTDCVHTVTDTPSDTHTQTVYYWADGYWTDEKAEAELADRFCIYAGLSMTVLVDSGSTQFDIDLTVRNLINRVHPVTGGEK